MEARYARGYNEAHDVAFTHSSTEDPRLAPADEQCLHIPAGEAVAARWLAAEVRRLRDKLDRAGSAVFGSEMKEDEAAKAKGTEQVHEVIELQHARSTHRPRRAPRAKGRTALGEGMHRARKQQRK